MRRTSIHAAASITVSAMLAPSQTPWGSREFHTQMPSPLGLSETRLSAKTYAAVRAIGKFLRRDTWQGRKRRAFFAQAQVAGDTRHSG